jgi:hypothetical protein
LQVLLQTQTLVYVLSCKDEKILPLDNFPWQNLVYTIRFLHGLEVFMLLQYSCQRRKKQDQHYKQVRNYTSKIIAFILSKNLWSISKYLFMHTKHFLLKKFQNIILKSCVDLISYILPSFLNEWVSWLLCTIHTFWFDHIFYFSYFFGYKVWPYFSINK